MFSTGKMCKFSRTLYNRLDSQFSYKISKSRERNYIFHSYLVSAFNIFVQCQSTMFRAVHSMRFITVSVTKSVSFCTKISLSLQNNHWLSQTWSSLIYLNLVFSEGSNRAYVLWNISTVCGPHHHDPRFIYLFYFQVFFFKWSSIPDSTSPANPRTWFSSKPRSFSH